MGMVRIRRGHHDVSGLASRPHRITFFPSNNEGVTTMPNPRKPSATLAARGAFVNHPNRKRSDVPISSSEIGAWRSGPKEPAKIWAELVALAPAGVLQACDGFALESVVLLVARMRANPLKVTPAQVIALFSVLGKLAMTPTGRAGLGISIQPIPPP